MNDRNRHRRKKKRKKSVFPVVLVIVLCILGVLGYIGYSAWTGKGTVGKTVSRTVAKKAIEQVISSETGKKVNIDAIESTMETQDRDTLNSIMDKYATGDTISKAAQAYQKSGGDLSTVKSEMQGQVDSEDMDKLKALYEKYGDNEIGRAHV